MAVPLVAACHMVPVTIWTPAAAAEPADTHTLLDLVRGPLRYYRQALAIPYPYPKFDLVFVPEFRDLAFSPPGLAVLQARLLDQTTANRPLYLACVLAHELAHAWFGGLIDMRHANEMWMQEALATYLSRAALEETQLGSKPWTVTTSRSLPDHAYVEDANLLRKLEKRTGRRALLRGIAELMRAHAHSTITLNDLIAAWSQTSGHDLHEWAAETLVARARNAAASPASAPFPTSRGSRS